MRQRPDVYVCSKPLQYFNIKNIGEVENASHEKVLIVVGAFYDAKRYVEHIKEYDDEWTDVLYMNDVSESHHWIRNHRINNLFVENDASWKIYFINLFGHIKSIYVYEEGIGSYNSCNKRGVEAIVRRFLGIGNHNGDSSYCKGIYLTKPWLYNQKFNTTKGRAFKLPFQKCLQKEGALFEKLAGTMPAILNVSNKCVLIYVTEWSIHSDVVEKIEKEANSYDLCFIKLHPHIKTFDPTANNTIHVLQTPVMMEMILYYLLKQNNQVTVWHHCSTSVVHFIDQITSVLLPIAQDYKELYLEYINA